MLHYRLCFLQCDWQRDISLQKAINVNEAQGIGQTSPDPLLSWVGSGQETTKHIGLYRPTQDTGSGIVPVCVSTTTSIHVGVSLSGGTLLHYLFITVF